MPDRKYSVAEIDRMRALLWDRGYDALRAAASQGDYNASIEGIGCSIEDQLRTYMLNGTDPSELENKE